MSEILVTATLKQLGHEGDHSTHTVLRRRVSAAIPVHHIRVCEVYGVASLTCKHISLLKPTDHLMHKQFNIQQLYALPTLYLFVLYLSEYKQLLVLHTS
jgi:hypothetical protein